MRPAKVLFLDNLADTFISHRLPLAIAAMERGWNVHVATPESVRQDALRAAGFTTHTIALGRRSLGIISELRSIVEMCRLFRNVRPDLVHLRTPKPVIYGGIAARIAGVPCVASHLTGLGYAFTAWGWRAEFLRLMLRPMLRLTFGHPCQRVIFQNHDDQTLMLGLGALPRKKALLIRGSGVDTDKFRPSPSPGSIPLVVLPARMLWDKGVGEFVEAARLLASRRCRVRCILVGDSDPGNPRAIPEERLRAWHAEGVVEWRGPCGDMVAVYAQASIVCLPSYYGEGLPKSLLEGMACGLPIVAADAPGCREACRDGDNGLLVPPRNALALADALQRLLEDPSLAGRMGIRGRERAVGEFSLEHVIANVIGVFRQLLQLSRNR